MDRVHNETDSVDQDKRDAAVLIKIEDMLHC